MKGHEPLIAMRREGRTVGAVWFAFDGESWRYWPAMLSVKWRRYPEAPSNAEVLIEPADTPARLDLRFVVGLRCWVQGDDAQRVRALHQACQQAGASRVLSAIFARDARGNPKTVEMLDTEGQLETANG